jgi:hypothetical protein
MPQYELDNVGPDGFSGRTRGRTPEEAVRRALGLAAEMDVVVSDDADLKGWQTVRIDGEEAGRVRPHQRMQFRRD